MRVDAAPLDEVSAPLVAVEQHHQRIGGAVADADDRVGVHDVVDIGHVLVADALDVVLAVTVVEQRRALERLHRGDPRAQRLLEMIARGQSAGRAGRRDESGERRVCERPSASA